MATRQGQFMVYGGFASPDTTLTTIMENDAYGLWVRRTWVRGQWHIEIIRKLEGVGELNKVELFLTNEEVKLLKESLS